MNFPTRTHAFMISDGSMPKSFGVTGIHAEPMIGVSGKDRGRGGSEWVQSVCQQKVGALTPVYRSAPDSLPDLATIMLSGSASIVVRSSLSCCQERAHVRRLTSTDTPEHFPDSLSWRAKRAPFRLIVSTSHRCRDATFAPQRSTADRKKPSATNRPAPSPPRSPIALCPSLRDHLLPMSDARPNASNEDAGVFREIDEFGWLRFFVLIASTSHHQRLCD